MVWYDCMVRYENLMTFNSVLFPHSRTSLLLSNWSQGASLGAQRWRITCQCGRHGFHPWVRKIPWRSKGQYSSIPAWAIPWTEEPGGLQSMGPQRVGHELETKQKQNWSQKSISVWATKLPGLKSWPHHIMAWDFEQVNKSVS